ncbi:MAG: type II toxin-antitoxin system RelE/ParE family toxin [Lewinellaceae bacterium]|nr:type II toxin-antitoxin system RelE/ParE family toxin [Phaeodactylibacter sp.]MCB9041670.1 type II toxin-antitoxin system RelE/ParE family toxin [Lewinellaceae bacterium]
MRVQLTATARKRYREIYDYFKSVGASKKGRRIRAQVNKKILLLRDTPMMGQEEESLVELGQGHRYLVEEHYKIIYRIIDDVVYITDIFDTRQDSDKMKP